MQVHLDAPLADLNAGGAEEGAGSVPAILCTTEMFNLMIYIKIYLVAAIFSAMCIRVSEQRRFSRSALRKGLRGLSGMQACRFAHLC
jgi:hypothetical protein